MSTQEPLRSVIFSFASGTMCDRPLDCYDSCSSLRETFFVYQAGLRPNLRRDFRLLGLGSDWQVWRRQASFGMLV